MKIKILVFLCLILVLLILNFDNGYDFEIEIDGGINLNNVKTVTDAGVELVVAGSSVFGAEDIPARVAEFLEIL